MKFQEKISEDLGYIKGLIEGLDDKVVSGFKRINGDIDEMRGKIEINEKKIQRHDVLFGKLGVYISIFVFAISTGISFIIDFFRNKQ